LVAGLPPLDNTIQYSWLIEMCRRFFGFDDDRLTADNWERLYDHSVSVMAQPDWAQQVLAASRIESVFLTNDFDDPLEGFDTRVYVPCLRTDDLVFKLSQPEVRQRLAKASGISVENAATLRQAIGKLFAHFKSKGARACAISLPPDFVPRRIDDAAADAAVHAAYFAQQHTLAEKVVSTAESMFTNVLAGNYASLAGGLTGRLDRARDLSSFVFWTLAEYCADFKLPFDLMIGVNRAVYAGGVYQGQDLYDSRVSLIQYRELFNAFHQVTFPISVLASVTNQELTSYSWIFPNVVTNGHWWYSNTPNYIEFDAAARLEAVPRTKQIGYYSDMYKLEFALPKFAMYKRILAKILAERFVIDRGWSEAQALGLARQVLRGNVERIFGG
jgi:glucuronate isomerase